MKPAYYTDPHLTLHTGDALDVLSELPTDSVHCIVTSPPYWKLRDYGTITWAGGNPSCAHPTAAPAHHRRNPQTCLRRQYGLEPTPEDYVDTLRAVFIQLRSVLVTTGTVWLNLRDSYSNAAPKRADTAVHTDVPYSISSAVPPPPGWPPAALAATTSELTQTPTTTLSPCNVSA